MGEERNTINQKFDTMFWELKEMGMLCWRDMEVANVKKWGEQKRNNLSKFREVL